MKEIITTLGIYFDVSELNSIESNIPFPDLEPVSVHSSSSDSKECQEVDSELASHPTSFSNKQDSFTRKEESPNLFLFKCQFCEKGFTVSIALSKHIQKHFKTSDIAELAQTGLPDQQQEEEEDDLQVNEPSEEQNSTEVSVMETSSSAEITPEGEMSQEDSDISQDLENGSLSLNCNKKLISANKTKRKRPSKNLECPVCNKKGFQTKFSLCRHLGALHYHKKLENMYGPFKSSCSICNKKINLKISWLAHLLNTHKVLPILTTKGEFLDDQQKADKNSEHKSNLDEYKHSSTGTKSKLSSQELDMEENRCFICQKVCKTKHMIQHLVVHYRKQLVQTYGPYNSSCQLCDKKQSTKQSWMKHLIVNHKVLPTKSENGETTSADKNGKKINSESTKKRSRKVPIKSVPIKTIKKEVKEAEEGSSLNEDTL
jgi:hypothetical protein